MAIRATFPAGVSAITVNGLHQWDYGQVLEIVANDLPAVMEVHFACQGMIDAVVRSCASLNGVASAVIPDRCLEQTAPILAWVYSVGSTEGATIKTVTLTVTARTRPSPKGDEIPQEITDAYTQTVAAMNAKINVLETENETAFRAHREEVDAALAAHEQQVAGQINAYEAANINAHAAMQGRLGTLEADGSVTTARLAGEAVTPDKLQRGWAYTRIPSDPYDPVDLPIGSIIPVTKACTKPDPYVEMHFTTGEVNTFDAFGYYVEGAPAYVYGTSSVGQAVDGLWRCLGCVGHYYGLYGTQYQQQYLVYLFQRVG